MAAPVRIESRAWSDIRFATLARLLGLADSDHALIKVARLWSWQTEHFAPDAPTYAIDIDTIESVLGAGGAAALVRAKLADETPGGYRMHGTEGQIEWCADLSSTRQQAGRTRAAGAKRDARGRLMSRENGSANYSAPAHAGCAGPAATSSAPAQSSAPTPTPTPTPEEKNLSPARAPEAATPPQSPRGGWHDRKRWWDAMLAADERIRVAGIEPLAPRLAKVPAGENEKNLAACARQLTDAGFDAEAVDAKMLHIIAVAEAEAMRDQRRLYFKPALIWDPKRANRAADTSLAEASRPRPTKPGEPARMPARRADPPVVVVSDADRADAADELAAARTKLFGVVDGGAA